MGGKQIVALDGSLEEAIANKHTSAKIMNVESHELLFDGLIKKDYDVGVVDAYVRRHHQSKLGDFRVVASFPSSIQWIYRFYGYNKHLLALRQCLNDVKVVQFSDIVRKYALESEKPNVETDMVDFFSEPLMLTVSVLAAVFIVFSIFFGAKLIFCKYIQKNSGSANITGQVKKPDNIPCENKSTIIDFKQPPFRDDLKA